jgi:hypothetical protein
MGTANTTTLATMADQTSPLSKDNVRDEAREILSAIDGSRRHRVAFEANWRRLWQLVREANAARLPSEHSSPGPWQLSGDGDHGDPTSSALTAGRFSLPIWPAGGRLETDLAGLLNWAGVPTPHGR